MEFSAPNVDDNEVYLPNTDIKEWSTLTLDNKEWSTAVDVIESSASDFRDPTLICNVKEPTFAVRFLDPVLFAEFAPYDWCGDLICVTFEEKIVIGKIKKEAGERKIIHILRTFIHDHGSPTSLCWNPATLNHVEHSNVCFSVCIGCNDMALRVFTSDLGENQHTVKVLKGHTDFVNCAMYHPNGLVLATGSDDFTCRIWRVDKDYECTAVMNLRSLVMSVRFNSDRADHVLVAVKSGKIYLMNISSKRPLKMFNCEDEPLLMADWSPSCSNYLATIVGDDLVWWDDSLPYSTSSVPMERRATSLQNGQYVCFAPWSHKIVATFGGPEPQYRIKVFSLAELKEPLFSTYVKARPWNISWHKRVPIICAGIGKRLCFWELPDVRMLG